MTKLREEGLDLITEREELTSNSKGAEAVNSSSTIRWKVRAKRNIDLQTRETITTISQNRAVSIRKSNTPRSKRTNQENNTIRTNSTSRARFKRKTSSLRKREWRSKQKSRRSRSSPKLKKKRRVTLCSRISSQDMKISSLID